MGTATPPPAQAQQTIEVAEPIESQKRPVKLTGKPELIREFLARFDVFLFDCDGVLWQGDKLLPKVVETLDVLRNRGKQIVFVTNNSTKSREDYKKKLAKLGIQAEIDEIFGSAYSAAIYISRVLCLPPTERVYILGEAGIEAELRSENITFLGGTDPADSGPMTPSDYETFGPDPTVTVVLCGLDRNICYKKLARAYQFLQNPNCRFLATNIDSTFPTHGKLFPGAGSMSAPLTYMLGGRQPVSLGKPSQAMMAAIEGKFRFDKSRTCMVGDRLNTDITFGIEGGLGGTLAVLTGVNKEDDFLKEGAEVVPDAYLEMLGDLAY
ncbi:2-phosphoglycolate phosphatase [Terfezia boudieri ATCC MYA-4762]|uniref:4-nitrophenylphosphatase n=1 Tax=Terfezia boudieri ATCC MYA-4762 TaxID=1051890 RepID=A0A3N4LFL9_9PEZI|nr:2-phosphoglycolate phosphatase [Terfezia boudieri ATCC MYA-4762]